MKERKKNVEMILFHVSGLWVILMTLSKLVELGDTIFIVLRKQPLVFLHWYHHISTLIYCWNSYSEQTANGENSLGANARELFRGHR